MKDETRRIDYCECVYCGHIFDGIKATNGDMDCESVSCPECHKSMDVFISIEFTCKPPEV